MHNSVQGRSNLLHLHLEPHFVLQEHLTSSLHAFDASGNVTHKGTKQSFSFFHPHSVTSYSGMLRSIALHQILKKTKTMGEKYNCTIPKTKTKKTQNKSETKTKIM